MPEALGSISSTMDPYVLWIQHAQVRAGVESEDNTASSLLLPWDPGIELRSSGLYEKFFYLLNHLSLRMKSDLRT